MPVNNCELFTDRHQVGSDFTRCLSVIPRPQGGHVGLECRWMFSPILSWFCSEQVLKITWERDGDGLEKEEVRCYTRSSMENKELDSFRLIWTSPRSCRTVISLLGSISRWSSTGRCLVSGPLKATYRSSCATQPSSPFCSSHQWASPY